MRCATTTTPQKSAPRNQIQHQPTPVSETKSSGIYVHTHVFCNSSMCNYFPPHGYYNIDFFFPLIITNSSLISLIHTASERTQYYSARSPPDADTQIK